MVNSAQGNYNFRNNNFSDIILSAARSMSVVILFIILTFIIIAVIILMADSMMTSMLMMSLLANFLAVSAHFSRLYDQITINVAPEVTPEAAQEVVKKEPLEPAQDSESEEAPAYDSSYGPYYEAWQAHHTAYGDCYDIPTAHGSEYSVDNSNALMAQKRARDKKCSDGWASKNADYFKYHYAGELNQAENKPWWGRHDW